MRKSTAAVVAVLALALVAPIAGAAPGGGNATSANATTTPTATSTVTPTETPARSTTPADTNTTTSNPTEYTIAELKQRGTSHEGAPDSMRFLSDYGSATLRHEPSGPFSAPWEYVKPAETTVNRNKLTLRTIRLAPDDELEEELTVHVVAWQQGTKTVTKGNKTVEQPAAINVTERTHTVDLSSGYDNATVPLPANYAGEQQITMWVEEYPSARWVFDHHSIPTSQTANINDLGDLFSWAGINVVLPGLVGLLVCTRGARKMIDKTVVGPMKGATWWGFMAGLGLFAIALFAWFKTAVLLSHIPQLFGVIIAAVGFVAVLETAGRNYHWALFERHELEETTNPEGDSVQDVVTEDVEEVRVARADDGSLRLLKPGIMPFLARFFASPAKMADDTLKTQVSVNGKWLKKYLADPHSDTAIDWTPAHWTFRVPLLNEETHRTVNGEEEKLSLWQRLNGGFVVKAVSSLGLGYMAGAAITLPMVGLAVGAVPVLAMSLHANDGFVQFEPAPVHMRKSEASLTIARDEYSDAKTIQQHEQARWQAESQTAIEARELQKEQDKTVSERIIETLLGESPDPVDADEPDSVPDTWERQQNGAEVTNDD